jgi:hypothetical protein
MPHASDPTKPQPAPGKGTGTGTKPGTPTKTGPTPKGDDKPPQVTRFMAGARQRAVMGAGATRAAD